MNKSIKTRKHKACTGNSEYKWTAISKLFGYYHYSKNARSPLKDTGRPRFILCFALLRFTDIAFFFFFLQMEGWWHSWVKQVHWCHFSDTVCSLCVSVSYFVNSRNISNFFFIIISVTVICDQ